MPVVDSIAASGNPQLTGDVTVSEGTGIVLTQAGQDIEIALAAPSVTTYESIGALTASSSGTQVTPPGSANTKGSWVELVAATAGAADGLILCCQIGDTGIADFLIDIGTGAGGAETVLIPNILFSYGTSDGPPGTAFFPIQIPAGTRIAARCQSTDIAATSIRLLASLVNGGVAEQLNCTVATTYGADTTDSGGTAVDAGATPNTKGAWAQLDASVDFTFNSCVICLGQRNNAAQTAQNILLDIGVGAAAAETVIIPNIYYRAQAAEEIVNKWLWVPVRVAAGERLAARIQSSSADAGDRVFDVAVVGFS